MRFTENFYKLLLIVYVFIFSKNILQIFFGIITTSSNKQYDSLILINPFNFSNSTFIFYLLYFILYELVILGTSIYLPLYILLFFIVRRLGNKISIHILYLLILYCMAIWLFNVEMDPFCILVIGILGFLNWFLFKKWVNEK
ncbi:hypothetical protein CHRY9293_03586 [Chryseobacterium potabilaquae]|uniref:Uncharacterized protein n=1 Tax=Chryseobacterium potabilaquae TaxID=2675057 RepID=A0A6N4XB47_9FLAO|nr:hypothetical protein CHRY9293_03586 [Chryseobacterium potabilaquae]